MKSNWIESIIKRLNSLEYKNIYTGTLEKPVQSSYIVYSDVISLVSELRKELKEQQIRETAYFIWLETGCTDEYKNWINAKKIIEKAEKEKIKKSKERLKKSQE